jgi:hypothetical protein
MPKFLIKASYTVEGLKGLKKDKASGREKAIAAAMEAAGGKLEGLWYCGLRRAPRKARGKRVGEQFDDRTAHSG